MNVLIIYYSERETEIFIEGGYYAFTYDYILEQKITLACFHKEESKYSVEDIRAEKGENFQCVKDYYNYSEIPSSLIIEALTFFGIHPEICNYIHVWDNEYENLVERIQFIWYPSERVIPFFINSKIFYGRKSSLKRYSVLDYCPIPTDPPKVKMQKILNSNDNLLKMRELAPEIAFQIIHVLHGWKLKELRTSLNPIGDNEKLIAFGSCFSFMLKGYRNQIITKFVNLLRLIQEYPDLQNIRFHILGASGANPSHICWYAGLEQTDSASWRRIAAFGKIAFVGVTEISISNRSN